MASSTPTQVATVQLGAAVATHYTVATGRRLIITRVTLLNTTATDRTVDFHLVPTGGSADGTNQILDGKTIESNLVVTEPYLVAGAERQVLEGGGTIQVGASAATAITMVISGVLVVTG